MAPDTLIYPVVDALGMPLHLVGDLWRGAIKKSVKAGPFPLDFDMVACSDALDENGASFLVRAKGDLWFYVISQPHELRLIAFDGGLLGLKAKDVASFGTGLASKTIKKFRQAIRKQYVFNQKNECWEVVHAAHMVEGKGNSNQDCVAPGIEEG